VALLTPLTRASLVAWALMGCHAVFDGELGVVRCEREGAYGPPDCPPAQTCVTGVCIEVGAPLGAGCASDDACRAPGWCLDVGALGHAGGPRCSKPCCSSAECGAPGEGQVCFAPAATAGAFCWPSEELGRAAPGWASGGTPCKQGGDCRSGLCETSCSDVCCGDASCEAETVCRLRFSEETNGDGWSCGKPPSAVDEQFCYSDHDCQSGHCALIEGLGVKLCLDPCCNSRECDSIEVDGVLHRIGCAPGPNGRRACARALPASATGAVGAPCSKGAACLSGICLPEGYCSDLCCEDASCGDPMKFSCRLGEVDGFSALRCIRR
jgi:hypothetical protein